MNPKFSRLVHAGSLVHLSDGRVLRCTSKVSSDDLVTYRFADLQGKKVESSPDFYPLSQRAARFASWMRYVVAYNKDFDLYVKEYIRAAGLPVDEAMNWSKWFDSKIAPLLNTKDVEARDEAIHHIIINTLAERNALANFDKAIQQFPEHRQNESLARQVTTFLIQSFRWRVEEANNYIKKFIHQENTDSMWSAGESEDGSDTVNILDTEEHANGGGYESVETDVDIARFRSYFANWLKAVAGKKQAVYYVTLFDLIYEAFQEAESPKPSSVYDEWHEINEDTNELTFKKVWKNFPRLIETCIKKLGDKYSSHPFLEIMKQVGKRQKSLEPATASVKTADSGFYGMDVAPMDAGGELVKDTLDPGNDDSKSFAVPAAVSGTGAEDIGTIGADTLAEIAPMALAASKVYEPFSSTWSPDGHIGEIYGKSYRLMQERPPAHDIECPTCSVGVGEPCANVRGGVPGSLDAIHRQRLVERNKLAAMWETPTCKGCGSSSEARECPACNNKFCSECLINHHSNNPSHERLV